MVGTKRKNSLLGGLFWGLTLMLILTSPALAVDTYWTGLNGKDWIELGNWTNGVPAKGYHVFIDKQGADVFYPTLPLSPPLSPLSNPTLKSLRLGLDPLGPQIEPDSLIVALTQLKDLLTVKNTEIGSKGTANYFHDGGTLRVLQDLTLGTAADGEGNYNFGGGSLSVGGHETLGKDGAGLMLQSPLSSSMASGRSPSLECTPPVNPPPPAGPTHSVGKNLYLGVGSGSEGTFLLTDSSLTVGGSNRVGIQGAGLFLQTNSIVKIEGNDPDPLVGEGTLSSSPDFSALSKKNLKNNKLQCVSSRGPGLVVGLENEGSYTLSGGSLNVDFSEIIGLDKPGVGTFAQTNGTHTINGNLYLGKESGSFGSFNLSFADPKNTLPPVLTGVGILDVHGFASVGYLGEGNFFQNGGTVNVMGIDQEVNQKGKSLSNTLSKGSSLSCSQHQYIGFTVGRGGIGSYFLHDGELLVSHGEIIGMISGSDGTFTQVGGNHFIGGDLTIARDSGSKGLYTLNDGILKVQGSLLNNHDGAFDYYGGELQANVINKGTFNAYGPGARTFPKQFFNDGSYKSTLADNQFTYLYVAPKGYIDAGATDNYYVTKEFTNNSKQNTKWNTYSISMKTGANLIFTGPGRKPFKTGSDNLGNFENNFAWGSLGIEGNGSVQLLGHLYADQIRGVKANDLTKKITNLFGYCGIGIYYDSADSNNSYLNGWILTTTYGKPVGQFTSSGFNTFVCH